MLRSHTHSHRSHKSYRPLNAYTTPRNTTLHTNTLRPLSTKTRLMSTTTQLSGVGENTPFKIRVGLCQIMSTDDKKQNLLTARDAVTEAVKQGSQLVVLPECFNCVYDTSLFSAYQEPVPAVGTLFDQISQQSSPTTHFLSSLAIEYGIYLVGGSYPEHVVGKDGEEDKIYNTSPVFDPQGSLVAKHRKVHLFDIDIPGRITFKESLTLSPGNAFTTFTIPSSYFHANNPTNTSAGLHAKTKDVTIGLGICYDIRFAEYAQVCRQKYNADILVYPGVFNTVTGPAHWKSLLIARSLDNQVYTVACSQARNPQSSYQAYGYSSIISPWGEVAAAAVEKPTVIVSDLDIDYIEAIRQQIPIGTQRRTDMYSIVTRDLASDQHIH